VNEKDLTGDATARCESSLKTAAEKGYASLRAAHVADHQHLFNRVKLDVGKTKATDNPTDERLAGLKKGNSDPQLAALYFQFGRYLLIGSSRSGYLPANLQGKWCQNYKAPWSSDYHLNINFQMNYWPAQITNLAECHLPYFDYVESLVPFGEKTAKDLYGADGWVVHHLSDIFGMSTCRLGVVVAAVHGALPFYRRRRFSGEACLSHHERGRQVHA